MANSAKTIQIFLPSGEPQGIRMAEITTRIVQVVEVPRAVLADFFKMPESGKSAVYFLFGDGEAAKPKVYIGQTADKGGVKNRLADHNKSKDFWQRAVVVLSRTDSLTATHTTYLERLCIQTAKGAGRYSVSNDTGGNELNTTRPVQAECDELFDTASTLLSTLGYPVFTSPGGPTVTAEDDELFYCTAAGTDARARYTAEGMVVLKGSKARVKPAENFKDKQLFKRRQSLIDAGILAPKGDHLVFTEDYAFGSPSSASGVVVGNSNNGWDTWKASSGKTLSEVKRQVPAAEQ